MRKLYAIAAALILFGVVNGLANSLYSVYMVFWVLEPSGSTGPLFGAVAALLETEEGFRVFLARRQYSVEGWQSGLLSLLLLAPMFKLFNLAFPRREDDDSKTEQPPPS